MESEINETYLPPKERLVAWLARLYRHRLTTTTGGNLSFLDDDGVMYITPSGGDKAEILPSNVASCKPGSNIFEGMKAPSMEWQLHKCAYEVRPDCRAVLHAHSMALIAFSLGVQDSIKSHCVQSYSHCVQSCHPAVPDTRCLFSAWMTCGQVGFCPYFPPGSEKLAAACAKMLSQRECVVLQNHGVVTIGSSLQEAFDRFVTLENLAQSIINALPLGKPHPLNERILEIKKQINTQYQIYLRSVPRCTNVKSCCLFHTITGCEKEARFELCRFVQRAYEHNIFTSSSGSISIRSSSLTGAKQSGEVSFVITPTNVDRQNINPSNVCFISNLKCKKQNETNHQTRQGTSSQVEQKSDSNVTFSKRVHYHPNQRHVEPSHSSEIHERIYSMHPEVNSIVIAQPPYVTSFCITGKELNADGIPESHLILGNVKTLPFVCLEDGGLALSRALDLSKGVATVIINGFGIVSVAATSLKAYVQVEVCESICGVMLTAMRRGTPALLTNEQVKEIDVIFKEGH